MWVLLLNRLIRETSHGLCATDAQMVKVTLGEKNEVVTQYNLSRNVMFIKHNVWQS